MIQSKPKIILPDLPDDIQITVINFLSTEDGTDCRLVCKRWTNLLYKLLWNDLTIKSSLKCDSIVRAVNSNKEYLVRNLKKMIIIFFF
jgi:hypothetical protein